MRKLQPPIRDDALKTAASAVSSSSDSGKYDKRSAGTHELGLCREGFIPGPSKHRIDAIKGAMP